MPIIAEEPTGKDVFGGQEKRKWLIDYPSDSISEGCFLKTPLFLPFSETKTRL